MPKFRNCTLPAARSPPHLGSSKAPGDPLKDHITEGDSIDQVASLTATTTRTNVSGKEISQLPSSVPIRAALFTAPSPEPYVSVGCLKCGALDHSASNRNCPRPRKVSTASNGGTIATTVPKKSVAKTPKKPGNENHHIKKARLGDDTKFWDPIKDGKNQKKDSSTSPDDSPKTSRDNMFRSTPASQSTEEQLNSSPLAFRSTGTSIEVYKTPKIEEDINLSHGFIRRVTAGEEQLKIMKEYDKNGFGSAPSLPGNVPAALVFSSQERTETDPNDNLKTNKPARNRKRIFQPIVDEEDERYIPNPAPPRPRQLHKTKLSLIPIHTAAKTIKSKERPDGKLSKHINNEIDDLEYSPQPPAHPVPNPSFLSRRTTKGFQNDRDTSHSSTQPDVEEKPRSGGIRYNYMGARNYIQQPRVRYADDRVQGWRECRSMGTGLE